MVVEVVCRRYIALGRAWSAVVSLKLSGYGRAPGAIPSFGPARRVWGNAWPLDERSGMNACHWKIPKGQKLKASANEASVGLCQLT